MGILRTGDYKSIQVALTAAKNAEDWEISATGMQGFYFTGGAVGDEVALIYEADLLDGVPKKTGVALTLFGKVYLDSGGNISSASGDGAFIGYAAAAAASAATTCSIILRGATG